MTTYDTALLTFDGVPIAFPTPVRITSGPTSHAATLTGSKPIALAFDVGASEFHDVAARSRDMAAFAVPGSVAVTIPLGLLGTITIPMWVKDRRLTSGADETEVTLDMVTHEQAWRRAVSIAVQRAICLRRARVSTLARTAMGQDEALYQRARDVLRYRGERKQRRAMRRLLRAAGLTASS